MVWTLKGIELGFGCVVYGSRYWLRSPYEGKEIGGMLCGFGAKSVTR